MFRSREALGTEHCISRNVSKAGAPSLKLVSLTVRITFYVSMFFFLCLNIYFSVIQVVKINKVVIQTQQQE